MILVAAIFGSPALSSAQNALPALYFKPASTSEMRTSFAEMDYRWPELHKGVPPLYIENIPEDFNQAVSTRVKKQMFFMALLPMVLMANAEILQERAEAIDLLRRFDNEAMGSVEIERLTILAKRYGLKNNVQPHKSFAEELLRRIDQIPPSLALAQAANESAWGTSRFAKQANNLFGEWTFTPGAGIVPKGRPEGATYEVRRFNSLYASIRSYLNNLNSHRAYRKLREIRSEMREQGHLFDGLQLAEGLKKYSERGQDYVKEIQSIIRGIDLARVNQTFLRESSENLLALYTDLPGSLQAY